MDFLANNIKDFLVQKHFIIYKIKISTKMSGQNDLFFDTLH